MAQRAGLRSIPSRHRDGLRGRTFGKRVAQTAGANVVMTGLAGGAGLYLAVRLGAAGRGRYAAVQSWFGVLTIVGELGMAAAVCYFVAREPARAPDWVATSRALLLGLGVVTGAVGLGLAPVLATATGAPLAAFMAVFGVMPVMFTAGAWSFALQATDNRMWNLVRIVNPAIYAAGVVALGLARRLTVVSAAAVLVVAVLIQSVAACLLFRRRMATGRVRRDMLGPLLRYGVSSFTGSVPYAFSARIDQVVLAVLVANAQLGNYAVAVSLTVLAAPLSSAFGSVAMPSLARGEGVARNDVATSAWRGALLAGCAVVSVVTVATSVLAPRVLGPSYRDVPVLVLLLAPGAVLLGANQVLGDILRGRGRPLDAGRSEAGGLVATVVLLATLVPRWQARGAAVASTVAYSVSFLLLMRRVAGSHPATRLESTASGPKGRRGGTRAAPTGRKAGDR